MKAITIEIPDGKKAEWVNGVLTLVDDQPIEYKYKVGDKVKRKDGQIYTITGQFAMDREPWYGLTNGGGRVSSAEGLLEPVRQDIAKPKPIEHKFKVGDRVLCLDGAKYKIAGLSEVDGMPGYSVLGFDRLIISEAAIIELVPQDMTEVIKTYKDAVEWCKNNGKEYLLDGGGYYFAMPASADVIAYLKLRIITCALNEGWEPTLGNLDERYDVYYNEIENYFEIRFNNGEICDKSSKLCFRRSYLARYAATQFADIYADFCGVKKGGQQ